jgi:colanic acid biosynthesis glycosyl transferase WcaI
VRILLISQWCDPEPFPKGLAFARALRARGHEVQVLTGFPNYPGGKVYPGYRVRLYSREVVEGVSVVRVALFPSHDESALRRVANYASFAFSAALLAPWLTRKADVAYVYAPPATVALPAMVVRIARGTPFVYDIGDMWPDTLAATGMVRSKAIMFLVGAWCRLVYRAAARVVATSPGFVPLLASRGVPASKVSVIANWCDEFQIRLGTRDTDLARTLGMEGRFNVLFAGNMGKAQALDTVLDAAALAAARMPAVQFVFIGGGVDAERLERTARERRLENVRFLPRCPYSEIGQVQAQADVLLVHLRDEPLFRITTPSKIQAYLFAGKPILAAVCGDAADLVIKAGAGVVCPPESPAALCDAVERLYKAGPEELSAMGERGRAYYARELSLEAGTARFEELFRSVAADAG